MKKQEITDMYVEILANFLLLKRYFGYENPLDIYTLYSYMLTKGYLSKNKKFERAEYKLDDVDYLPFTIMHGKGVCRNISYMLSNIYNVEKLDNDLTLVYSDPPEVDIINSLGDPRTKAEKLEIINNYSYLKEKKDELIKKLNEYGDKACIRMHKLNKNGGTFIYYLGNHVVNTVLYKDTTYVLDPTNNYSLKQSKINKLYLLDEDNNPYHITTPFAKPNEVNELLEKLKNIKTTFEEDDERIKGILVDCKSKEHILEDFYEQNKRLYKGISRGLTEDKILRKIKKKGSK